VWARIGASASGQLLVKESTVVADNGASSLHGPFVLLATMMRMDNLYRFRALRSKGELVYTNVPPSQCQRGFGDPEGAFVLEQLIDEVGRLLGADPVAIRKLNAVRPGDTTLHGWNVTSCEYEQCLEKVAERIRHDYEPRIQSAQVVVEHGCVIDGLKLGGIPLDERYAVGYGLAGGMHTCGNRLTPAPDSATARIEVRPDEVCGFS